jgi:hypothetical protein
MEWRQVAFLLALSAATAAALVVPGASIDLDVLVVLLGVGVAATALTGYGGLPLLLCIGEAFAVGLGTASPLLGVLFQPAIAVMLCDDDRVSLVIGGSTTVIAAAGVLVFREPLFLLLVLLVVSASVVAGLIGFDGWLRRRLSSGYGV